MKKFRHFKQFEKKEEKNNSGLYLSIFLAVIMVGGVAGIFLYAPSDSSYSYGKYSFSSNPSGLWITKINKKETKFYSLPDQVTHINVSRNIFNTIENSQGIILSFNPDVNSTTQLQAIDLFKYELTNTLIEKYPEKKIGFGITKPSTSYKLPVASCANSTFAYPIVSIDYSDETSITLDDGCIIAKAADEQNLINLMDRLRYGIYGVME